MYPSWLGTTLAQIKPGEPTSAPAPTVDGGSVMLGLVAVGLVVLAVWIIRCIAQPRRIMLYHTPGRPNHLSLIHLIVVFFLAQAAAALAMEALGGQFPDTTPTTQPPATQPAATQPAATQPATTNPTQPAGDGRIDPRLAQAAGAVSALIWLAAGLIAAQAAFRHGLIRGLGLSMRHWIFDALRAAVGYFAILPVCVGLFLLCQWITAWLGGRTQIHPVLLSFRDLAFGWQALAVFNAVVMAALAEEVFFRGLLQSYLRRVLGSPWVSILVASALFALVHAGAEPQAVPSLFALGVAMGYNYERTGRLVSPILIHAIFNAVALLLTT